MKSLLKRDFKLPRNDGDVATASSCGSGMSNLLQMLGEAEKIASEGFQNDFKQFITCDEIEADELFTPSIFDIPNSGQVKKQINSEPTPTSFPPFKYCSQEDPFEPTPIGPCIRVVNEIPVTSLLYFQNRVEKPSGEAPSRVKPRPDPESISQARPRVLSMSPIINGNRKFQENQWKVRFQDLLDFQRKYGHLLVPHAYSENPKLSQWVKRQRYQHRLKQLGRHNTLSDDRETLLIQVGFVWDSHDASWNEHYQCLEAFYHAYGHLQIPPNKDATCASLSTWCKHQRRQYRIMVQGGGNNTMTIERIRKLESIGFEWNPRNLTAACTGHMS